VLRADSGFCREELMSWCESNHVDYRLGLARNKRLRKIIGGTQMHQAQGGPGIRRVQDTVGEFPIRSAVALLSQQPCGALLKARFASSPAVSRIGNATLRYRIELWGSSVLGTSGLQFAAPCIAQGGMTLRSPPDTIRSLRLTLKKLEQSGDIARDSMDFAQLKRIFFKRITELEMELARRRADRTDHKIAS